MTKLCFAVLDAADLVCAFLLAGGFVLMLEPSPEDSREGALKGSLPRATLLGLVLAGGIVEEQIAGSSRRGDNIVVQW